MDTATSPRKRALFLTAFLACLSFLIFGINALAVLLVRLASNERLWEYLNSRLRLCKQHTSEELMARSGGGGQNASLLE